MRAMTKAYERGWERAREDIANNTVRYSDDKCPDLFTSMQERVDFMHGYKDSVLLKDFK